MIYRLYLPCFVIIISVVCLLNRSHKLELLNLTEIVDESFEAAISWGTLIGVDNMLLFVCLVFFAFGFELKVSMVGEDVALVSERYEELLETLADELIGETVGPIGIWAVDRL